MAFNISIDSIISLVIIQTNILNDFYNGFVSNENLMKENLLFELFQSDSKFSSGYEQFTKMCIEEDIQKLYNDFLLESFKNITETNHMNNIPDQNFEPLYKISYLSHYIIEKYNAGDINEKEKITNMLKNHPDNELKKVINEAHLLE